MTGIAAYTPCEACSSAAYSATFEQLDKLTDVVDQDNISMVIENIEKLAQECLLKNHAIFFRFKFDDSGESDRYWKALKVKARNPESVVDTISASQVVQENEFGIRREVYLKADPSHTPRGENVFINENQKSVLFVVKPPDGFSIATNRIVTEHDGVYYQGVYFYLRHRDPLKEDLLGIHGRVFENIKNRVADGSMEKLYSDFYKN